MSNFEATLRMELTAAEVRMYGSNLDLKLRSMYEMSRDNTGGTKIQIDEITVVATGEKLKRFEATVAAQFQKNGMNYVQTTGGDIIPLRVFYPM